MTTPGPLSGSAVQTLLNEANLTGDWVLDSPRSKVELNTRHTWGLRGLKGVFGEVTGTGTVSSAGEVTGTIEVVAASIDTKNKTRDKDLRSPRFFEVGTYPHITFTLERITPGTDTVAVTGSLTVRDQTRPLSFPVQVSVVGEGVMALDGEAKIDRTEYGLSWNMIGMASTKNTIVVHAVFTKR